MNITPEMLKEGGAVFHHAKVGLLWGIWGGPLGRKVRHEGCNFEGIVTGKRDFQQ